MIKMVSKKYVRGKLSILLLFISIIGLLYSCNSSNKEEGFVLEEFVIDDSDMKSIADSVVEMHLSILQSNKQILSLNLSQKDSALFFIFSVRNEKDLVYNYIYRENKRIVGYTNIGDVKLILLSDINNLSELGSQFGKFIHPTGNSEVFKFLNYPQNLYIGEGENAWPTFELIYDPTYIVYPYVNNRFLYPIMTKNPNIDINSD